MSIAILSPPASEPVSLAEAKLFLRVDHDAEDGLIASLVAAAREAVEAGCGRALIARGVRETLDAWRLDERGAAVLGAGPVSAVAAVRLLAPDGAASVLDPAAYRLDGGGDRARLVFAAGAPAPLRAVGGVEIDYTAGFAAEAADVPSALRIAVLQVAAALYEARQGEAALPETARALMRPYAAARL